MLSDADATALAERLLDPDARVYEVDFEAVVTALKALPESAHAILEQRSVTLFPVDPGMRIDDVSSLVKRDYDRRYPDTAQRDRMIDALEAVYVPAERRIYFVNPEPGTIVHEVGHVVDVAISHDDQPSSVNDRFLGRIHDSEALNAYSRTTVIEAWAEWYRSARDISGPVHMEPAADDKTRAALERNAP